MVKLNQLGEAARVASFLALDQNKKVQNLNPNEVRRMLGMGGSIII